MWQHVRVDIAADHYSGYCFITDEGSYTWSRASRQFSIIIQVSVRKRPTFVCDPRLVKSNMFKTAGGRMVLFLLFVCFMRPIWRGR